MNSSLKKTILFFFSITVAFVALAAQPKFTLIPSTPTSVIIFDPLAPPTTISYLVTNRTSLTRTLTMVPIQGITQTVLPGTCGNPFTLAPGFSCILNLTLDPALLPTEVIGGPEICKTLGPENNSPDPFLCSQACGASALFIRNLRLVSITVTPANATIPSGTNIQYTATGHYSDGSSFVLPASSVTWLSSNPAVANISNTGLASGHVPQGTTASTVISASQQGITGSTNLTVTNNLLSIDVTPKNQIIVNGTTLQYTAMAHFQSGPDVNVTASATWTTGDMSIATIAAGGLATGVGPRTTANTTTVTASLGSVSGSTNLTVRPIWAYIVSSGDFRVIKCAVNLTTNDLNGCGDSGAGATLFNSSFIALNPQGTFAYIPDSGNNTVKSCTVNPSTGVLSACNSSGTTLNGPQGIAINAAGSRAYIVNNQGTPITKCDITGTGTLTNCSAAGNGFTFPAGIVLRSTGDIAYVTNSGANTVRQCPIDGSGNIGVCADSGVGVDGFNLPTGIALNSDLLGYVVNQGDSNAAISMCIIDGAGTWLGCVPTGVSLSQPFDLVLNATKTGAFITNTTGAILVSKCDVIATISNCVDSQATGINGPAGITLK